MNARVLNAVTGRLSLRPPQAESLSRLVRALAASPELLGHERDVPAVLTSLKADFPTLEDFEREFPSLCFALATGVGKTRLMGAFISYLHLAHGINNFFVLAPNLTIYNKLIVDFTRNTPKYVFKGIAEFAQQPPLIITGDNYDQSGAAVDDQPRGFAHDVRINIFNISKINSEVRGGKEPRIKRMKEVLGDSYFNHLANLPDLVLLMDESHRYRASAGVRSINDLKPLFGLELTATPFVEAGSGKTVPFKNVVMDYPLARAMEDGFVKEPAVVTQRNFDAKAHTPEEIEKTKLEDGVRLHETTKVELLTYARENGVKIVKPFMLVIARDTTHAGQLLALLESQAFYEGRYQGKVIQVDSSRTGAEEEEMVIHVNMLKEGWDVTNLYTIVPLRAANARTLIEQSIGRGLRLPYGKRTGVAAVDRLNIVAHDKFQEIIDDANRADSPIRLKQVILDAPSADDKKVSVQVGSGVMTRLGLADAPAITVAPAGASSDIGSSQSTTPPPPVFATDSERHAARVVMEVIGTYEVKRDLVPTSNALLRPEVQREILAEVTERLRPLQGNLIADDAKIDLAAVVARTTEIVVQQTIDIPRIAVVPTGDVTTGFHPFKLDIDQLHLQPGEREIVGQMLRTNEQFTLASEVGLKEARPEDYIVHALVDFDDIDYFTHADLLYDLAGQLVQHLLGYLSEDETRSVLDRDRRLIAREIHAQMMAHFWEQATSYEVQVSRGFTELKQCNYTATAGQTAHHFRETLVEMSRIKQMLFGGFERCLYPLQKFDSDTERRFCVILERDALKWFKPAKGQFQIYYKLGTEQPEYVPDFVAETDSTIYMVETKARTDVNTQEVQAKADSAARWCKHASDHAVEVGTKPWKYLLLPHDEITESKRLSDYLRFEVKR
jgi:type III restriction enzyme